MSFFRNCFGRKKKVEKPSIIITNTLEIPDKDKYILIAPPIFLPPESKDKPFDMTLDIPVHLTKEEIFYIDGLVALTFQTGSMLPLQSAGIIMSNKMAAAAEEYKKSHGVLETQDKHVQIRFFISGPKEQAQELVVPIPTRESAGQESKQEIATTAPRMR